MATPISEATAAGESIIIGGKTYQLRPLTFQAIGFYERWMRAEIIATAREVNQNIVSERERMEVLEAAYQQAGRISLFSANGSGLHQSPAALMKLSWLSLHTDQPKLTEDDVYTLLANPKDLEAIMDKIRDLNAAIFGKPGKPQEASPDSGETKSGPPV